MRTNVGLLLIVGALGLATPSFAAPGAATQQSSAASPIQEVRHTIDEVVKIVEQLPGDNNKKERRAKLRGLLDGRFDFEEMAKRSLGTHWTKITPDQQNQFIEVFSELLAHTYLARIETVKPGMVTIDSERAEGEKALVKTTVKNRGDAFPIDYKLLKEEGVWKVYDVAIENIGLVANYRNEFAGILRREDLDGLISRLRSKQTA